MHVWALIVLLTSGAADGVQLTPTTGDELQSVLEKIAHLQEVPPWCASDCVTFLQMRLSGSLLRGEISIDLQGSVTSLQPAYAALLGAASSLGLSGAALNGHPIPLFWSGEAYAAVLPPGSFSLHAVAHVQPGAPLTLTVPGPVGEVDFAVADASVEGSGRWRGVSDATYHLIPQSRRATDQPAALPVNRLRLRAARSFMLSRDKRFTVSIEASGATLGQVIALPLLPGEAVEELDPHAAHLATSGGNRRIDWVAASGAPTLTYGGKWTEDTIQLSAPTGASHETWEVRCDDPFECTFTGNAEAWVGHGGHAWEPLAGQQLTVAAQQLTSQPAVQTVAQEVQLINAPLGNALHQEMHIEWTSSTGSLVGVRLPPGAQIGQFTLQNNALPLLKDAKGVLQVGVPQGNSSLHAEWQLPGEGGTFLGMGWVRPPVPLLSEPVSTLYHHFQVAPGRVALLAGGLPGSPRITLWGNLAAVLLAALAVAGMFYRLKMPFSAPGMWLLVAMGYAIETPTAILPLALTLAMGRWLSRLDHPKKRLWIAVDLILWVCLGVGALGTTFDTLDHALFADAPFGIIPFVNAPPLATDQPNSPLVWGAYLAGSPDPKLPAPWVLTLPLILVRLLWAGWAITLAFFLLREGRLALNQLAAYWKAATGTI